ncbi:MAG: hypothetical protein RH862_08800 [Leptospiraceae bacterium]
MRLKQMMAVRQPQGLHCELEALRKNPAFFNQLADRITQAYFLYNAVQLAFT